MPQLLDLRTKIFIPRKSIEKPARKFPGGLEINFDTIETAGKDNRLSDWKRLEMPDAT
jgi:hypothetical protein